MFIQFLGIKSVGYDLVAVNSLIWKRIYYKTQVIPDADIGNDICVEPKSKALRFQTQIQ